MEQLICRAMTTEDLHTGMLDSFDRRQEITREQSNRGRTKKLRKPRMEDWTAADKKNFICQCVSLVWLRHYYPGPPVVFAAFWGDQVAAFATMFLEEEARTDAEIMNLYVSRDCRGQGLGRQLFGLCAEAARASGKKALIVAARPAAETQAFYRAMGCVPAGKAACKRMRVKRGLGWEFPLEPGELRFIPVQKRNRRHRAIFIDLMLPYNKELDDPPGDELVRKVADSMLDMLGPHDRHLELVFLGDAPVGFFYGKIDHATHRGFVKPGYGYVMEFYVRPEHRRKGYATQMLGRLEQHFACHGVARVWLTTGSTGEAFWRAMGFAPTGEISPDNGMAVLEKSLS